MFDWKPRRKGDKPKGSAELDQRASELKLENAALDAERAEIAACLPDMIAAGDKRVQEAIARESAIKSTRQANEVAIGILEQQAADLKKSEAREALALEIKEFNRESIALAEALPQEWSAATGAMISVLKKAEADRKKSDALNAKAREYGLTPVIDAEWRARARPGMTVPAVIVRNRQWVDAAGQPVPDQILVDEHGKPILDRTENRYGRWIFNKAAKEIREVPQVLHEEYQLPPQMPGGRLANLIQIYGFDGERAWPSK